MTNPEAPTTSHETSTTEDPPRLHPAIWVGSLLDHEYAVRHGTWINADQPTADIRAGIDTMLAASPIAAHTRAPAERWQIFRQRGFGGYHLTPWEGLHRISQIAHGLVAHGRPFAAWARIAPPDELGAFDTAYLGHYDSVHSYLEQLINDLGYDHIRQTAIPAPLQPYVKLDITATTEDLMRGGDLHAATAAGGGVWIFRG